MKKVLVAVAILCSNLAFAQQDEEDYGKMKSYKASNGKTYSVGDSVVMGYGSSPNGSYQYFTLGGFGAVMTYNPHGGTNQWDAGKGFAGLALPIKKIKSIDYMGQKKVYFVVMAGTKHNLWIEDAIASCEVKDCTPKKVVNAVSDADELAKFKKLMDDGVITPEEFAEKKKLILSK